MNKGAVFILLFSLLLTGIGPVMAIEPPPALPTIHWIVNDFPPFLVLPAGEQEMDVNIREAKGPFAGIYRELMEAMPRYQHRFIRVSFLRGERLFRSHKGYCTILLQKSPERDEYLYFGDEIARSFPVGLVTLEEAEKNLPKVAGEVDLEALLAAGPFRLGVVQGRSYSQAVDRVLAGSKVATRIVGDRATGNLFLMLEKKRVDGVLAYYLEMADYRKETLAPASVRFTAIKGLPPFISLWPSCERSPWGGQTLKEVSKAVKEKKVKAKIYQFFMQELPPSMRKPFREFYGVDEGM